MKIYTKIYNDNYLDDFLRIFDYISIDEIIDDKYEIKDSLSILRSVNHLNNISILTKINGDLEKNKKIEFLNKHNITLPIIFVPFEDSKTDYVKPDSKKILIDDNLNNIDEWISHGGIGILFSDDTKENYSVVNDLSILKAQL